MKKFVAGLIALVIFTNLVSAQEDPEKALSKADKALAAYAQNIDPTSGDAKLKEAVQLIEVAAAADINKGKVKTWQTRGEIYNAVADQDVTGMIKDPNYMPKNPEAPIKAAESFMKAAELATKKFETKEAIKGMTEAAGKLNNVGNSQIKHNDYAGAYNSLNMVMVLNDIVVKNGNDAIIPADDMPNHKYVVAYCAGAAGKKAEAGKLLKELVDSGKAEASVYAQYFDILYKDGNKDEAWKIFDAGQQKFPTSTELLFAGINAKIVEKDYENLKKMLAKAIDAEPDNASIYTALGNVYMSLFNDEYGKNGNNDVSKGYFDESLKYFNTAISKDPKQFDAIYSIGSLYFNKAVEIIKVANALPMDNASQKKYTAMMEEAKQLMGTALPYFQKTEAMDPNDVNTLIALSEIFARQNETTKSQEFKARLEKVRGGGKNETSYFKN